MRNIVGAYHIAMMNNWREVVAEQTTRMVESGLLNVTDQVFIGVVGGELDAAVLPKAIAEKSVIVCSPNLHDYEFVTLRMLQDYAAKCDCKAWYVHTKGVSRPGNQRMADWRRVMGYFVIDRFGACIRELNSCDACGINITTDWLGNRFFGGNFWWSSSRHMSSLPKIDSLDLTNRFKAEHWIGMNSTRLVSLYDGAYYIFRPESLRRSHPVSRVLKNGVLWDGKSLVGDSKISRRDL